MVKKVRHCQIPLFQGIEGEDLFESVDKGNFPRVSA